MSMVIEGFSCLGSFGDVEDIVTALRGTACSPETAHGPNPASGPQLASAPQPASGPQLRPTDLSALSRFFSPRSLRQCDRFTRLALLGASLALENAGLVPHSLPGTQPGTQSDSLPGTLPGALHNCGIVLASGYGSATPTFEFLDSIMTHGEGLASPLAFSLSVHNIPAASIAKTLHMEGPCATVCQFDSAVASALLLAQGWLAEGRVERVLLGAVDENTPVLESITEQLRQERTAQKGNACRRSLPLSEGAVFFVLGGETAHGTARIESVQLASSTEKTLPLSQENLCIGSGALPRHAGRDVYDGNAAFGNLPIALACNCAAALHMLHSGQRALCLHYGVGCESAVRITQE